MVFLSMASHQPPLLEPLLLRVWYREGIRLEYHDAFVYFKQNTNAKMNTKWLPTHLTR